MKIAILALFVALPMVGQTPKGGGSGTFENIAPYHCGKGMVDTWRGCAVRITPPILDKPGGSSICRGCGDGDFTDYPPHKGCSKQPETDNGGEGCNPEGIGKKPVKRYCHGPSMQAIEICNNEGKDLQPPILYKNGIPSMTPELWKGWTELRRTPEYMVPYSYTFDNDGIEMDQTPWLIGSSGKIPDLLSVYVRGNALASKMETWSGSIAVMLADEEYSKLQQLRQAVVDEEKRLAVKYGAALNDPKPCPPYCVSTGYNYIFRPDHYEFHSQFLLIEKGSK